VIVAAALGGVPDVGPGDDLAALLSSAAGTSGLTFRDGDVLVVAHKVVSKAEGRTIALAGVTPGERALALAAEHGKDARLVEVILGESTEIVRSRPGVLICRTRHGFVCANAGVDASNAAPGEVVLLPVDPDASARALRARLRTLTGVAPAIVVADSFGRAWRVGQCDVAIGIAGLAAVEDWRGRADATGRALEATVIAVADEAAATADLARRKDSREPAVLLRGLERHVIEEDGPGAAALVRARAEDLFLAP
jgi:coenzyme F420-0:L-glutamate ligase/coenzyme F420-1:gamma-L-glutamate ligase